MGPIFEVITLGILTSAIYEGAKYAIKNIVDTGNKLNLKPGIWNSFKGEQVSIIIPSKDFNERELINMDRDSENKLNLLKDELQNSSPLIDVYSDLQIPLEKLTSNIILIGPPNVNSITNFILPRTNWGYLLISESIISKKSNEQYLPKYDESGNLVSDYALIVKTKNPFDENHSFLYFGGLSRKSSYPFPYFFEAKEIKKIGKKHSEFTLLIRVNFLKQKLTYYEILNLNIIKSTPKS